MKTPTSFIRRSDLHAALLVTALLALLILV